MLASESIGTGSRPKRELSPISPYVRRRRWLQLPPLRPAREIRGSLDCRGGYCLLVVLECVCTGCPLSQSLSLSFSLELLFRESQRPLSEAEGAAISCRIMLSLSFSERQRLAGSQERRGEKASRIFRGKERALVCFLSSFVLCIRTRKALHDKSREFGQ